MIALIQRVAQAHVLIDQKVHASIGPGLLALVCAQASDSEESCLKLLDKLIHYRVFSDSNGKMNLSLRDTLGDLLIVSQFTLSADTRKGRRPSFSSGASPELAKHWIDYLIQQACKVEIGQVQSGVFGADMQVSLTNDGPVTFWLEV